MPRLEYVIHMYTCRVCLFLVGQHIKENAKMHINFLKTLLKNLKIDANNGGLILKMKFVSTTFMVS